MTDATEAPRGEFTDPNVIRYDVNHPYDTQPVIERAGEDGWVVHLVVPEDRFLDTDFTAPFDQKWKALALKVAVFWKARSC